MILLPLYMFWTYVMTIYLYYCYYYRIAGNIRGGLIFAVFTGDWHPRKINPWIISTFSSTCCRVPRMKYKGQSKSCKKVKISRCLPRCMKNKPVNNLHNTSEVASANNTRYTVWTTCMILHCEVVLWLYDIMQDQVNLYTFVLHTLTRRSCSLHDPHKA